MASSKAQLEGADVGLQPPGGVEIGEVGTFSRQLSVLLKKNFLNKRRNVRKTLFEILFPVYMTGILCLISLASESTTYPAEPSHVSAPIWMQAPNATTLAYLGDSTLKQQFFANASKLFPVPPTILPFDTMNEFKTWYGNNSESLWALIDMNDTVFSSRELDYTIRMKEYTGGIPLNAFVPPTDSDSTFSDPSSCYINSTSCNTMLYVLSGFGALQRAFHATYYEFLGGNASDFMDLSISLMPLPAFDDDGSSVLRNVSVMFFIMALSPIVQYLMNSIVTEKENGIKEALYLMGMRPAAYWISWLVTYAVIIIVPCILMAIIGVFGGVLPNSNVFAVVVLFYIFSLSIICLAFAITPFFSSAKVAGIAGSLTTTIFSLVIFGLGNKAVSAGAKWGVSIISFCAASVALNQAAIEDATAAGFNFNSYTLTPKFSILDAIIMMLVDCVLYTVLAWYLDGVVPGNGPPRPWYFPITEIKALFGKTSSTTFDFDENIIRTGDREDESDYVGLPVGLSVQNVSKMYSGADKNALTDVSIDMYEGQIFGLLGHNGAGKTTLHSIITGLLDASSGRVCVFGQDLRTDEARSAMRRAMGVCPQKDILYEQLTVKEHLYLFGGIKGIPLEALDEQVETLLKEIDLDDKHDAESASLSGGQKRKLSVGIALIGNPKILCLDEPSSGMDPYSRRKLWELLQSKRAGRITLLTTHYMQEADVLADRKAIMSKGKIQVVGSSIFLKARYGIGYHLNLVKEPSFNTKQVDSLVMSHIDGASKDGETSTLDSDAAYCLPTNQVGQFKNLFRSLTDRKAELGVSSFGVSITSLEEVFLRLQKLEHEQELAEQEREQQEQAIAATLSSSNDKTVEGVSDGSQSTIGINGEDLPLLSTERATTWQRIKGVMGIRYKQNIRNYKALFFQIFLPIVLMVISLTVVAKPSSTADSGNVFNKTTLDLLPKPYASSLPALPFLQHGATNATNWTDFLQEFVTLANFTASNMHNVTGLGGAALDGEDGYLTTHENLRAALGFELNDDDSLRVLLNNTATHALPIYLMAMDNTVLDKVNASSNAASRPLPYSSSFAFDSNVFYILLLLGMGLSTVPGGFAIDLVLDRKLKMKHQLRVSGVSALEYWGSYLATNIMIFLFSGAFAIILALITKVEALTGPALLSYIIAMALYLPTAIIFSFVVSFSFDEPETCQQIWPQLNSFLSFIPFIVVSTLDGSGYFDVAIALHYVFLVILPPYSILGIMYFIFRVSLLAQMSIVDVTLTVSDYWKFDNHVAPSILVMVLVLLSHCAFLYLLENWASLKHRLFPIPLEDSESRAENSDPDVEEEARVAMTKPPSNFQDNITMRTQQIAKKFDVGDAMCRSSEVFTAVGGVSFTVRTNEVFGLLGPNGAGKTTSISIITGEEVATSGEVYIGDAAMSSQSASAMKHLGFCPQFSALWPNITASEHLLLYARLRGLSSAMQQKQLDKSLSILGLTEFADVQAIKLSGGTQRKLSVAMALVNQPELCLLDEPSTGMDPGSRRILWEVIKTQLAGRAALLTTHSMEEAEALCSRIGIMVKGKLVCVGSPQHLKTKFGDGYTIELKTQLASQIPAAEDFVKENLVSAQVDERFGNRIVFRVSLQDSDLVRVFEMLEAHKGTLHIQEYAVSQATLEQVFLKFARKQDEVEA
eukprot:m.17093 g.17093  ORF g.17093 m.17093 type:complete len:1663 (+) comp7307_c0_seq1:134-5122(+)